MNIHKKLRELTSKQDDITHLNESTSGMVYGTAEYRDAAIAMRKLQAERAAIAEEIEGVWNEMLEALEAVEEADAWDNAALCDTIREMKEHRIPIHARWSSQIEALGHRHFNDSNQLRELAKILRTAAIARARGER